MFGIQDAIFGAAALLFIVLAVVGAGTETKLKAAGLALIAAGLVAAL